MPLPMAAATLNVIKNMITKLKNAAMATAWNGVSVLVATTVAMLLAASWNPLVKSKISATAISTTADHNIASNIVFSCCNHIVTQKKALSNRAVGVLG